MTPTLSVEAVHVTMIELVDLAVPTRPVGVDGGVRSPVGVGDGLGDVDGLADGEGDADGDGEALGLTLGLGLTETPGVTRPVIVHVRVHWSADAPWTMEQFWACGAAAMTARGAVGAAHATPAAPTTRATTPTAMCVAKGFARCKKVMTHDRMRCPATASSASTAGAHTGATSHEEPDPRAAPSRGGCSAQRSASSLSPSALAAAASTGVCVPRAAAVWATRPALTVQRRHTIRRDLACRWGR